jgi:hypothetical protein
LKKNDTEEKEELQEQSRDEAVFIKVEKRIIRTPLFLQKNHMESHLPQWKKSKR